MIKSKRLILRKVSEQDLIDIHNYSSDYEIGKYMLRLPYKSIGDTKDYIKNAINEMKKNNPKYIVYVIILDSKVIGEISIINKENNGIGDIGWIIDKSYQNNGYAYEAVSAFIPYASKKFKLSKIIAYCDSRNKGSFKVMQKLNMTYISNNRIRKYESGEIINELLCEINL